MYLSFYFESIPNDQSPFSILLLPNPAAGLPTLLKHKRSKSIDSVNSLDLKPDVNYNSTKQQASKYFCFQLFFDLDKMVFDRVG